MAGGQMCAHLDGRASTCPAPRSGCFKGVGRVPERCWPWKRARLWAPSEPGAPGPRLPSPRVRSLPPPRPLGLPAQMASGRRQGLGGGEAGGKDPPAPLEPPGRVAGASTLGSRRTRRVARAPSSGGEGGSPRDSLPPFGWCCGLLWPAEWGRLISPRALVPGALPGSATAARRGLSPGRRQGRAQR